MGLQVKFLKQHSAKDVFHLVVTLLLFMMMTEQEIKNA